MTPRESHCRLGHISEDGASLEFDSSVYRLSAVKKAAYRFGDRCFVQITSPGGANIQVTLRARDPAGGVEALVGEFCNEVLDQELREVVAEETESVRDVLMAQAFSAISLVDEQGDEGDYCDDPLGIRETSTDGGGSAGT